MNPDIWTEKTTEAIQDAIRLCKENDHIYLAPLHIIVAIFQDQNSLAIQACKKLQLNSQTITNLVNAFEAQMQKTIPKQSPPPEHPSPSHGLNKVFKLAQEYMKKQGDTLVAVDHLLMALWEDKDVSEVFSSFNVSKGNFEATLKSVRGGKKVDSKTAEENFDSLNKYAVDLIEKCKSGKLDPVIGRDEEIRRTIRVLARRTKNNPCLIGPPGVGKTAIVEGLAQRIYQGDVPQTLQNTKIFSLDMGLLIAGAKFRGEFEERLKSVLKEVTDAQGGIILFIDELHLLLGAGKTDGAMDAANLLKPALARGELRCIGATTFDEYRQYIEKDSALERRFQPVHVSEPSLEDTISILRGLKQRYETHHGVTISDAALVASAQLSTRYITNRFNPDKSIDLVDEACANTRVQLDSQPERIDQLERRKLQLEVEATALEKEKDPQSQDRLSSVKDELAQIKEELQPLKLKYDAEKGQVDELRKFQQKLDDLKAKMAAAERSRNLSLAADLKYGAIPDIEKKIESIKKQLEEKNKTSKDGMLSDWVGPEQIADVVSKWTGIPVTKLTQSQREKLLHLQDELHKRVVGQDDAVDAVAEAILRSRAGLSRPNQPTGSFLMLGPTGVGKTELAKAVASELFDSEKHIVRIDCSEYMEEHSVSRLIGSPPGYVGYEQGGQLTEAIRRRPYNVVLLDEVEKAHPRVLNVLLQVLDEGKLTDGKGITVDFSNTVIFLTSNLGSEHLTDLDGPVDKVIRNKVMNSVQKHFRPELLNRLDEIIIFSPLTRDNLSKIVKIQLQSITSRMKDKNITCDITNDAVSFILEQSYNPAYGARPLRRYLEKHIITQMSKLIIAGELKDNSNVMIGFDKQNQKLSYAIEAISQPSKKRRLSEKDKQ